jgi:alanine racemase
MDMDMGTSNYPTWAQIDLGAFRRNMLKLRELAGDRLFMLPVKADAYGSGAVRISQFVEQEHLAEWLAVSDTAAGLELRRSGVRLPILKLSPCFQFEVEATIAAEVSLTVVNADTVTQASRAAASLGTQAHVHLDVDTGMGRIGCRPEDALGLARQIAVDPNLVFEGVYTHLPVSDEPEFDDFTVAELAIFLDLVTAIQSQQSELGRPVVPFVHAANSGGLLCHSLAGQNMVRAGIAAFGYYPSIDTPRTLTFEPVMTLHSRVSFIKRIRQGECIGYGFTWTAPRDTWLATAPIGYSDGFRRFNSNIGRAIIGGRICPVAGRVSMEQTVFDLGAATPTIKVGDEIILLGAALGSAIDADDIAARGDTIADEVITGVSARLPRVYK